MFYENIGQNVRVGEYLQSTKYFEHCEEKIRRIFQPIKYYVKRANAWFEEKGIAQQEKTCVHLRRGDMEKEPQKFPSNKWFSSVFATMPPNAKFIFFSDDILWVKRQQIFANQDYVYSERDNDGHHSSPEDTMLDFTLMTLCDYFVLSRGSFGWWAAYLSKSGLKQVFYNNEFRGTEIEHEFEKAYYPPEWLEWTV